MGAAAGHLQDALSLTYSQRRVPSLRARGRRPRGSGRPPWSSCERCGEATADLGYAGEVRANIEAAPSAGPSNSVGCIASAFLTDQSFDIDALLDHPVILELKALGARRRAER